MAWVITDEGCGRNITHPDSGEPHDYVTRTYAPDEGAWPRYTITVSHFKRCIVTEVFFKVSEIAHATHASGWPIQLLGPIMATCKWAQERFKVNSMEPGLGTDSTYSRTSPGVFSLEKGAVAERSLGLPPLNQYVLGRVQESFDSALLGHYIPEGRTELRAPSDDGWSQVEYEHLAFEDADHRLSDLEIVFRHEVAAAWPLNERGHIWSHITRSVLLVWQRRGP